MRQQFYCKQITTLTLKLASFKEDKRPNRSNAASHVGAAVLAHVARSVRLAAALRWTVETKKDAMFYNT